MTIVQLLKRTTSYLQNDNTLLNEPLTYLRSSSVLKGSHAEHIPENIIKGNISLTVLGSQLRTKLCDVYLLTCIDFFRALICFDPTYVRFAMTFVFLQLFTGQF